MVPSLRVAEREGLGFVVGGEEWVSLASDSHFFSLVRQIWNASPALKGLLSFGFSHVRPSTGTVTTFPRWNSGSRVKLTFKAVPQAPGGVPLYILPSMKDHDTSLRRVHFGNTGGGPTHLNVSHDSLSVLSDYRPFSARPGQLCLRSNRGQPGLQLGKEREAVPIKITQVAFWKVTICIRPCSALRNTWTR